MSKYETLMREIHGDVKAVKQQVISINGSLTRTKERFEKHEEDSTPYRRKIDVIWAIVHSLKWAIIFLFGTGVLYKWIGK